MTLNKKSFAITLLAAQVLTISWIYLCPKFVQRGDSSTLGYDVITEQLGTSTIYKDGVGKREPVYGKKQYYKEFKHLSPGYFWAGVLIIYMSCISVYLLTDNVNK